MHYYFCPRCNFRMTATKPLCPTCGHKIPRPAKQAKASAENQIQTSVENTPSLLSKILKWNLASLSDKKTKSA